MIADPSSIVQAGGTEMPVRIRPLEQTPSRSGSVGHFYWSKGTPAPLLTGKIMDYEKKYKEALERARRLHDRMLVLSSTDALVASSELEFIFPELAESEDERIRKELKEAFEAYDIESKWNGIPIRSIFAWLEKQKEQKKKNVLIWGEPQVTITVQKQEWSEEDEEMLNSCISSIEEAKENRYAYKETDGDTSYDHEIAWLKSLRPSWKPSEDELTKKHLEGYIKGRNDALREMSDFMESHFNTQSGTSIKSGGNE